jgi:epoxyqueuosine reductase
LTAPRLTELARLDDAGFRAMFAGTSVKRTGRNRFLRNVLTAIGNAPEPTPELVATARHCLDDASPLVRGAAVWAFGRIAEPRLAAAAAEACLPGESDTDVRTEWLRLLAPVEYSRAP